jgi:hypothetical protein
MRTDFLNPGYRIKRLGRSCLSDDFGRRIALRTHNLPSGSLKKKDFGEVDEQMFEGFQRPLEIILCFLGIEKIDLDKVV